MPSSRWSIKKYMHLPSDFEKLEDKTLMCRNVIFSFPPGERENAS